MPKYELMYILAASVSDDQVPQVTEQIKQTVADFGATNVAEEQLGKKKLAYTIKKTKNGFYVVLTFDMPGDKIGLLDAKVRNQSASIVRYLIVNLDEQLKRAAKDEIVQRNMPKRQIPVVEEIAPQPIEPVKSKAPAIEINAEELDKKIEEALTEDITK